MILADTHTWLWWTAKRREVSARGAYALSTGNVAISPITFWDLAMLAARKRLEFDRPIAQWLNETLVSSKTVVIPITLEIATLAGTLEAPGIRDPADRIIVATAIQFRIPLVTKDEKIRASGVVETIW